MSIKTKKKILKRILVGTDFSRSASNAVVRASMLANEHSAKLEIIHVTPNIDRRVLKKLGLARSIGTGPGPVLEQHIEETRALARKHGIAAMIKIIKGNTSTTLVAEAARFVADLVVVGYQGERSFKESLIGTTAERILERWSGDVLVVKNTPKSPYATIIACVALAPVSCSVVMSAMALSANARFCILHAYQPLFEMKLLSYHAPSEAITQHRAAAKRNAVQELAELLKQCPVPPERHLQTIVKYGNSSQLTGIGVRHNADVIVVGKNQSVVEEFFLGSVTKTVVRSSPVDVMVSDSR